MYNVTLREGDIVVIHTGWGDLFEQFPKQNAVFNSAAPGIGKEAAKWLISQKVVAVGADTWVVEVIPARIRRKPSSFTICCSRTTASTSSRNVRTDLIAAEAAATNRATFFFTMTVPKAVGLTGNFVAPEAIR
jgi:kynurenine formamidase